MITANTFNNSQAYNHSPAFNHSQGFALLEALLALFILTIGVLGVAGLQIQAMQSGGVAAQRLYVTMQTQELIERMMANPGLTTIIDGGAPVITNTVLNYQTATVGDGINVGCNTGTICTPVETAQQDTFTWRASLDAFLPANPAPTYVVTVSASNDVTLTITWSDRGNPYTYAVTTQIQPLILEI